MTTPARRWRGAATASACSSSALSAPSASSPARSRSTSWLSQRRSAEMRRLRRLQNDRGQTAVEFALVTPVIIVLLLGIIQVGIAFHDYITVTDAARAGARKAVVDRFTGENTTQLAQHVRDAA